MDQKTSQDGSVGTATPESVSKTQQDIADNQPAKTYTQAELDGLMAEVSKKAEAKYDKKFGQVDVEHYKSLGEGRI
jgi:hypothetical protein